ARRYRTRLRARGVRLKSVMRRDPVLDAVCFGPDTLLSPGEQDVLRLFCAGFRKLPRLPRMAAVFGSRARGGSDERSDLDVAVFLGAARDRAAESRLSAIALSAQKPYWLDGYGISLRPVVFYRGEPAAFLNAIRDDLEVVWTRP
ncbi:MAG: nucleotidyltransferase domain-containing protein, partial [Proteobacteria bacterium]|nr:nucleotidyltransferase domain-containing protein [Pseudomonadota bacterium]